MKKYEPTTNQEKERKVKKESIPSRSNHVASTRQNDVPNEKTSFFFFFCGGEPRLRERTG